MAVALVASSTSGTTDTQSATKNVPVPAGAAAGHVAVIAIEIWLDTATDPTITWPPGFTQIAYVEDGVNGYQRLYVARKVLSAGDTGNYTMSWTGSYWNQAQCSLWSGVDNTIPLDVAVNTAVTAANTTMPAVSVTTVTAGCGIVHLVANENSATGTAPTGYTERQEANYLRTNTKVAGSAGAETPSGGSISVSTVKLGALVALRPAGGGGGNTTAAGTTTETDAAQPAGRTRATTSGTVAETDAAQPAGRTRATIGTPGAETDTTQPAGRIRTTTSAAADETDTALPAGHLRTTAVGTALESDTAPGLGLPNVTPAGTAAETDAAQPPSRTRTTTVGAAVEDATALLAGRTRLTLAAVALEVDSPQPISSARTTTAGAALEVDAALPTVTAVETADLLLAGAVEPGWAATIEPGPYVGRVET